MTSPGKMMFVGVDAAYMYEFRRELIKGFINRGYDVFVVSGDYGEFDTKKFADIGARHIPWCLGRRGGTLGSEIKGLVQLWRAIRRIRPQIIFAHTIKSVIYTLIASSVEKVPRRTIMIPGLGYAFSSDRSLKRRVSGALATIAYRFTLPLADMVIFQNEDDKIHLQNVGALPRHIPTAVVDGSGVDMEKYSSHDWPSGPPKFVMVCRLLRQKGVYEFVAAARLVKKLYPSASFTLVGGVDPNPDSIDQKQIDSWVHEGIVQAKGKVPDPRKEFEAAHVAVLPSYYREGCPRSNLEAMAMSRALITTDWVGCRETVCDGVNGYIVPIQDAEALARAMILLAADLDVARKMGEAGRRMCRDRFEISIVSNMTIDFIQG